MIGIGLTKHGPPLPAERGVIIMLVGVPPAGALVMHKPRVRGKHTQQPATSGSQAVIQVVIDDVMRLVEPAQVTKGLTSGHQAGPGYRGDVALHQRQPEISGIIVPPMPECMPRMA